jgi:limonene-1,2-epoxide hydrolase
MAHEDIGPSRRDFLITGGAGLALAGLGGSTANIAEAEMTDVENANKKLVLDMCKEIDPKHPDKLGKYLADDFIFQLFDGVPLVKGKDAFTKFVAEFFAPFERAEFIVHRCHAIGNLVINHRTDNFFAKTGEKDQTFIVSGFCLVKDGKITEWKDYGLPK